MANNGTKTFGQKNDYRKQKKKISELDEMNNTLELEYTARLFRRNDIY